MNKLLGELIANSDVTIDGVRPRATWLANPNITKWGLTWREPDDDFVEIGCSIFMKGVMLPGHGNVMEVIAVDDEDEVDVLICLHPLGGVEGGSQPDYIAVRLPWGTCSEKVCGEKANEIGMVFDDDEFPSNVDELIGCWANLTSA